MKPRRPVPVGTMFGLWRVESAVPGGNGAKARLLCTCTGCGTLRAVDKGSLLHGQSTSCRACWKKEAAANPVRLRHGYARKTGRTSEYNSWHHMKDRCQREKSEHFADYGGRGIVVCPRWLESFENFLADMKEKPAPKRAYTLERVDVNGNYEPGNCVWLLRSEQSRNTRANVWITAFGQRRLLVDWARALGVGHKTIQYRIGAGWSPDDAVSRPRRKQRLPRTSAAPAA